MIRGFHSVHSLYDRLLGSFSEWREWERRFLTHLCANRLKRCVYTDDNLERWRQFCIYLLPCLPLYRPTHCSWALDRVFSVVGRGCCPGWPVLVWCLDNRRRNERSTLGFIEWKCNLCICLHFLQLYRLTGVCLTMKIKVTLVEVVTTYIAFCLAAEVCQCLPTTRGQSVWRIVDILFCGFATVVTIMNSNV
jgi:hypothetical protein